MTVFWANTYCAPLERERRKLAVRDMGCIYEKQSKVLALEKSLRQLSQANPEGGVMRVNAADDCFIF